MATVTHYTWGNQPDDIEMAEWNGYDAETWDEVMILAQFDPENEENTICDLVEEWNGHPTGSLVVTGFTVEGYPFAIVEGEV